MAISTLTLHHFMQTVPVCEQKATLKEVLKAFHSQRHGAIVVVSEQQFPLGIIDEHCLLPYLVKPSLFQTKQSRRSNNSVNSLPSPLSLLNIRSLMNPITILPAQMSVKEFLTYLQADHRDSESNLSYGLVDPEGKFLGLLSLQTLIKSWLFDDQQAQETTSQEQPEGFLQSLYHLLEQLPLPLMVQTEEGSVLCQNLSWREQIGEFIPPDQANLSTITLDKMLPLGVQQQFSVRENILEQTSLIQPDNHYLADQLSSPHLQTLVPQLLKTLEIAVEESRQQISHFQAEPSKNALEKVWQFVKFPLIPPSPPYKGMILTNEQETDAESGRRGDAESRKKHSPRPRVSVSPYLSSLESKNHTLESPSPHTPPTLLWLVLATDVTEQQRLCKELAAKNADLLQLNRLKDEFLACISHELKSPLTSIVGLSSLLKEQKLGELNQRQEHYAELIYQSGRQLMNLVNDLLDLTRLETGQLKLKTTPVKIKKVCEQAYQSIQEKLKGKMDYQIPFTLEIETGLDNLVADELRLHQMLVHLLDNALKFTQDGGKVGLKVNRWENWIALTVWDTGIGIPEECQHLIFQKFQQLESPLTRQFEGAGLGLVLTQHLARAHGGEISFISKVGQGSQFTLLLPPNAASEEANSETETSQLKRNQLVLIVEAIPKSVEHLTEMLKNLGYRVVIARTGTEALEKARQLQPSIIFLNPLLPLLSGWDVLTLLKSDNRTTNIPVIITAPPSEQEQAKKNRNDGFLSLPVTQEALRQLLSRQDERTSKQNRHLTILRLHPESEKTGWISSLISWQADFSLESQLAGFKHRILEADDLEQAEMIAEVWKIDVVVLDGRVLEEPLAYLQVLGQSKALASLPLVTLDAKTTELANQVSGLSVFPCLIPPHEKTLDKLLQVIQIAAGINCQL